MADYQEGVLSKIKGNPAHPELRKTTDNVGVFAELPMVGVPFTLITAPLPVSRPGTIGRVIITTPVRLVQYTSAGSVRFWTENSEYFLVLKDKRE